MVVPPKRYVRRNSRKRTSTTYTICSRECVVGVRERALFGKSSALTKYSHGPTLRTVALPPPTLRPSDASSCFSSSAAARFEEKARRGRDRIESAHSSPHRGPRRDVHPRAGSHGVRSVRRGQQLHQPPRGPEDDLLLGADDEVGDHGRERQGLLAPAGAPVVRAAGAFSSHWSPYDRVGVVNAIP